MSKHSKGNILFAIFLIVLIIGSISTTYYLITKHNSKIVVNDNSEDSENTSGNFTFKEVSEKDTIDVFKKYPINPIDITLEAQVKISGLKNKEVENKINEKLAKLDAKKSCEVTFNYSNVLGIECSYTDYIAVNLIDGEDITIEDVFQKDSDILAITEDATYRTFFIKNDDLSNIENYIITVINNIKKGDYILSLYSTSASIDFPNIGYGIGYEFSYLIDDITIYDRFLTNDNIYENEITDYCSPQDCTFTDEEEFDDEYVYNYHKREYLRTNNIIDVELYNESSLNINSMGAIQKNINFPEFYSKLKSTLNNIYNLESENDYQSAEFYATIYNTDYGYLQVLYTLDIAKFSKEKYAEYLLGNEYADTLEGKIYYKNNMIITDNNEIKFLEDNPNLIFTDFRETLYKYVVDNSDEFQKWLSSCDSWNEECDEHIDYYKLIDDASYAIDLENKLIHIYYKYEFDTYIPFDIFTLKD